MSLPRLSQRDAGAYVALLLAGQSHKSNMSGEENKAMIARARVRRRAGEAPYAVDDPDGGPGPTGEQQRLASVISRGLSADRWQTPRAAKRFLNNLAIREQIADEAGAHLPLDVLVKMYLLELRHLPEFKTLAELEPDKRTDLLQRWEGWAHGETDAVKPPEVNDATEAWAHNEPRLAGRSSEIERYLSLAADDAATPARRTTRRRRPGTRPASPPEPARGPPRDAAPPAAMIAQPQVLSKDGKPRRLARLGGGLVSIPSFW